MNKLPTPTKYFVILLLILSFITGAIFAGLCDLVVSTLGKGLKPDSIIAIFAGIVVLMTCGVILWQSWLSRRHNMLSVRPHLDIESVYVFGRNISVKILNTGLGTAIIESVHVVVNDKHFTINEYDDYVQVFASVGLNLEELAHAINCIASGASIGNGRVIEFLTLNGIDDNRPLHNELQNALNHMELVVEYKCMYGKQFKLSTPFVS